ncbi:MAG TPA: biotin--[acetyl-CoA-carboxylase] ligase, partial [Bacillota bacterium]|nr:biotin--[acetyl-CoA-carboxylase] ligase [Bacillota bacterium]
PSLKVEDTPLVSLAAAVATQRAIERICGVKAGIKWPNDLVLDGKKLAGILVEMQATKQIKSLILGVGTNLTLKESELPPELAGRTSSLEEACGKTVSREAYLAALLEELDKIYLLLGVGEFPQILEAWRQNSVTLGKQLRVEGPSGLVFGTAMDVDRTGALLVATEDGQQLKILSGDITVRMADGTYT